MLYSIMSRYFVAQDDLFSPEPANPSSPQQDAGTQEVVVDSQTTNTGLEFLDVDRYLPNQEQLDTFILNLNYFTLAWCLFYAALLYANFYFNRMLYPEGEVPKEARGVSQIYRAAKIWWTYLLCLVFLIAYKFFPILSYLTIFVYFYKLLHWDLVSILDIIDNYFGINEILGFFQNIFNKLKKLLSFKF